VPPDLLMRAPAPEGDEIFELLEARRTLEPRVAQIAAARATGADFEAMHHAIDLLRAHRHDRVRAGQAESLFHPLMWHAARNRTLEGMLVSLFHRLDVVRDMIMRTDDDMAFAIAIHETTRAALMRCDAGEIEAEMDRHLGHLEQVAEEVLGRKMRRDPPGFL
jgi:DNA-binding FadR family transcriptional regulator